ncbi:MAG: hypothetical protein JOY60_06195 [Burkholderiaceae bacterium]|nr:hypothetical protein [Burkholderiaceae bacterium]
MKKAPSIQGRSRNATALDALSAFQSQGSVKPIEDLDLPHKAAADPNAW